MALVVAVVVCVITAALAARKGYNFFLWFFAGGLIGLCTLACLPFANRADASDETNAALRHRGNVIGGVLSGVCLVLGIVLAFAKP
jgi:zinc transporter ZupT